MITISITRDGEIRSLSERFVVGNYLIPTNSHDREDDRAQKRAAMRARDLEKLRAVREILDAIEKELSK